MRVWTKIQCVDVDGSWNFDICIDAKMIGKCKGISGFAQLIIELSKIRESLIFLIRGLSLRLSGAMMDL